MLLFMIACCDEHCMYVGPKETKTVHVFNHFDAMGICLNKQKLMYKVLAPSIITPM